MSETSSESIKAWHSELLNLIMINLTVFVAIFGVRSIIPDFVLLANCIVPVSLASVSGSLYAFYGFWSKMGFSVRHLVRGSEVGLDDKPQYDALLMVHWSLVGLMLLILASGLAIGLDMTG